MTAAAFMDATRWVSADLAALYLSWQTGRLVKAGTIRQWAFRNHISTSPDRRREPYDLEEIVAYARSRGLIESRDKHTKQGE